MMYPSSHSLPLGVMEPKSSSLVFFSPSGDRHLFVKDMDSKAALSLSFWDWFFQEVSMFGAMIYHAVLIHVLISCL